MQVICPWHCVEDESSVIVPNTPELVLSSLLRPESLRAWMLQEGWCTMFWDGSRPGFRWKDSYASLYMYLIYIRISATLDSQSEGLAWWMACERIPQSLHRWKLQVLILEFVVAPWSKASQIRTIAHWPGSKGL